MTSLRLGDFGVGLVACLALGCGDGGEGDSPSSDTERGTDETGDSGTDATGTDATGTDGTGKDDTGTDLDSSTGDVPPDPLHWQDDCTVGGADLGELHAEIQCTGIEVPLDWNDPDAPTIEIAAFRVPTSAAQKTGELWLLDGGPGGSGLALLDPTLVDPLRASGFDVVVPAHRGTLSPRLICGAPSSQLCRDELTEAWGEGLRQFSTLQAGRDLGELIERSRADEPGRIVVYGVSYGTFWAQYYLTSHPDQADGVVLDSVLPMNTAVLEQEALQQGRAETLLQRCVDDPDCGSVVGFISGAAFATAVVDAIDSGGCGSFEGSTWISSNFRERFGLLLNKSQGRSFLPVLAAMLERCTPELTQLANDALNVLLNQPISLEAPPRRLPLTTWSSETPGYEVSPELYYSRVLGELVMSSSILPDGADPVAPYEAARQNLTGLGFGSLFVANYEVWGDLPNTPVPVQEAAQVPVLVLNATFDLQTPLPWAEQVAEALDQPVFEFDDAAHGIILDGTADPANVSCGRSLVLEFATTGELPAEGSCVGKAPPVDVNLSSARLQALAELAFGTSDPWSLLASVDP